MPDLAYAIFVYRPLIFDVAGLILIGGILLYLAYIRYDMPWMARVSLYMFIGGGAPIVYFILTGYLG